MRKDERLALRQRFQFRCGYCGVRERNVGAELTVDHFQPRSKGGADEPGNWVCCCHACNEFKGDFWQPESLHRLLHPLRDVVASHLVEEADGTLRALSETGRFHIDRLQLNRGPLIEFRNERRLYAAERLARAQRFDKMEELEEEAQTKSADLDDLRSGGGSA